MSGFPLSDEQRRAVERTGQDVCVVAGPGSGKTRVLTERFGWLVEQRGVDPSRILAITFTEKAAIEIKQRVVRRFAASPDLREAVERAWVSTIHGFCMRLLRENSIAAGLPPDFTVLEQPTAEKMQRDSAEAALDELYVERPVEMRRLLEALDLSTSDDGRQDDLAASLLNVYEAMRVSGVAEIPATAPSANIFAEAREVARGLAATPLAEWAERFLRLPLDPLTLEHLRTIGEFQVNLIKVRHAAAKRFKQEIKEQLEAQWLGIWYADLHELLREALHRTDIEYRRQKRAESAVDFSDLEEYAVRLLESNPAVRRETMERFDEVLMDELQDTNRVQWRLVQLVKTRLYAVGDINQSIYGFRHADPDVFAEYRDSVRDAGGEIDELRGNYRSRPEILACVSRALDGETGIEPRTLEAKQSFRSVVDPIVERFQAMSGEAAEEEATIVARRILEWKMSGTFSYGDVAVLVRTLGAVEPFADAFERAGIPFLVSSGRGFLEARESLDVINFLAALVNVLDEVPLVGVMRGPLGGLSDQEIFRLNRDGRREWFEQRFGTVRKLIGTIAPDVLVAKTLDECDYWGTLTERARANADKLLAWLRQEFHNRPRPLAELLEDLEALREAQSVAEAPPPEAGDVVRVMTIHAAKGLEFKAVFVSALQRGVNNRTPGLLFSRNLGLGVKWRNPVSGEGVSDPVHARLRQNQKSAERAEANRLLYVAMTRAEERLILTHAEPQLKSSWGKLAAVAIPAAIPPDALTSESADAPPVPVEDTLLPAPELQAQYDSTASVTSVAMFAACPRKYYLSRYLAMEPEPNGPGTGAIVTGLAVHAILAGSQASDPDAVLLASIFNNSDWGLRAQNATRSEREFDFLLEIEDVILRGQIDLWFEESGELILIDYKTDLLTESATSYFLQLRLYALALQRYLGRLPDKAIVYYLRPDEATEVSLRAEDLAAARAAVRNLRNAQARVDFPTQPGDQCRKCSFWKGLCPEGRN